MRHPIVKNLPAPPVRLLAAVLFVAAGMRAADAEWRMFLIDLAGALLFTYWSWSGDRDRLCQAKVEASDTAAHVARARAQTLLEGLERWAIPGSVQDLGADAVAEYVESGAGEWTKGYLAAIKDMRKALGGGER